MQRLRVTAGLIVALAITGCTTRAGVEATPAPAPPSSVASPVPRLPTEPPTPLPVEPVRFPPFHEHTLANGARVIVVPNHEQPVVSVSLNIPGGSAADPRGKAGVAALTADLLTKGTSTRSAAQIAEAIAVVGGQLTVASSKDWTTVTTTVLTDFLDTGLELLADVVTNPTFPNDEIESGRTRTLSALQAALSQPTTLAALRFEKEVYGEHPYGSAPTPASVRSITRQDVMQFRARFYQPSNALVVVAGDVEPEAIIRRLDRAFAGWRASRTPPRAPMLEPPTPTVRRLAFVHKPGTVQAVYRIGHRMPRAQNDDWVELAVMNQVLGSQPSSWLFQVLREQKGYTYGAYSAAQERRDYGYFQVRAEVRNAVADSALGEMLQLLERIRAEPVPAADLALAKSYLAGSFPQTVETPQQVASQLANTLLLGRPADYLETFRARVAAATAADVRRVAREYLHPDRAVIVVVGDARQILDKLRPFADVIEIYDESGRPLAPGSLSTTGR